MSRLLLPVVVCVSVGGGFAVAQPKSRGTKVTPVKAENDPLKAKIDQAISISKRRMLTANLHTPWQIIHGLLAFRHDYQIKQGKKSISAMDYIRSNPKFRGKSWFQKTEHGGKAHGFTVPYIFQGHPNQFFALLSMSELPNTFSFKTDDGEITVQDLIKHAKAEVNAREEITWTLWALCKYLPPDAQWTNARDESWSIERLVRTQARANFNRSACGGSHGLFALARALKMLRATGKQPTGAWLEADQQVKKHLAYAKALQNRDGTLSAAYFKGRQHSRDFNRRIETTGHVLEFVVFAADEKQLREAWIRNAINAVCDDLIRNRRQSAKVGPLYHALDALVIYRDRVWPKPKTPAVKIAKSPKKDDKPKTPRVIENPFAAEIKAIEDAQAEADKADALADAAEKATAKAEDAARAAKEDSDRLRRIAEEKRGTLAAMKKELEARRADVSKERKSSGPVLKPVSD